MRRYCFSALSWNKSSTQKPHTDDLDMRCQDHSSSITIPLGQSDANGSTFSDVYSSCIGSDTMCWPMHWAPATACTGLQQQRWGQQWGYPHGSTAPYTCSGMQHTLPPAAGYLPVPQMIPSDAHSNTYQHSSSFWPLAAAVVPAASYHHQHQHVPCAQTAWQEASPYTQHSYAAPGSFMTHDQAPYQHSTETAFGSPISNLQQCQLHAQQHQPAHAAWWPFQAAYTTNRVQRQPAQLDIAPDPVEGSTSSEQGPTQEPAPLSFSGWQAAPDAAAAAATAASTPAAHGPGVLAPAPAAPAGAVTRLAHASTAAAACAHTPAATVSSLSIDPYSYTDACWAGLKDSFRPQSPWQPNKHAVQALQLNEQDDDNMTCMLGSNSTSLRVQLEALEVASSAVPTYDAAGAAMEAVEAEAACEDWQELTSAYWAALVDSFRPQSPWQPSNDSAQVAQLSSAPAVDATTAAVEAVEAVAVAAAADATASLAEGAADEAATEDTVESVPLGQELTSDVAAASETDQAMQQHSMVPKHATVAPSDTNEAADSSSAAKNSYKTPPRGAIDATKRRMRASDWAVPYFASNGASEGRQYRKSRVLR